VKTDWLRELGRATLIAKPVSLPDPTRVIRRLVDGD